MKVVGLITEYNPFHNGHKYHLEEAKKITGADYAIAVMSGNFVQRGAPAVIDKYTRTRMALENGIDIVFELPVCYATGSAEFFALGAVSLLNKLGIVDYLCFGSESGDINLLKEAAGFLLSPPDGFDKLLRSCIKDGLTYPAARMKATEEITKQHSDRNYDKISSVINEPNNILGIEYLKALLRLSSSIQPVTIRRITAHYHDTDLSVPKPDKNPRSNTVMKQADESDNGCVISSATSIRKVLLDTNQELKPMDKLSLIRSSIPSGVHEILKSNYEKTHPVSEEDFSGILKYKLLSENKNSLIRYVDISSNLADRIKNLSDYNLSMSELMKNVKTRNMTLTRISRALIHCLLNIQNGNYEAYNQNGFTAYARVLGMKKNASPLLRKISEIGSIPVITKVSKAEEQLDDLGLKMLTGDIFAAHLYNHAVYEKYKNSIPNEYRHGACIL